jgi:hypothetical protein
MSCKRHKEANMAEKVASTRHFVCSPAVAMGLARTLVTGLRDEVAVKCFNREPQKMAEALMEWAEEKRILKGEDPNDNLLAWAMREGRGKWNPDPDRYQRNADLVAA